MKRTLLLGTLIAVIAGLFYYSNVVMIKKENDKIQKSLQSEIQEMQEEKQNLENRIYQIEKSKKSEETTTANQKEGIVISNLLIESEEVYKEGVLKGKLYGNFNVKAKIKNNTSSDISNIKVASLHMSNISSYAKQIEVDSKAQTIDILKKGEEKDIIFTNYHVGHPETIQEVIVDVFKTSSSNQSIVTDVKKAYIDAAFAPGSND